QVMQFEAEFSRDSMSKNKGEADNPPLETHRFRIRKGSIGDVPGTPFSRMAFSKAPFGRLALPGSTHTIRALCICLSTGDSAARQPAASADDFAGATVAVPAALATISSPFLFMS